MKLIYSLLLMLLVLPIAAQQPFRYIVAADGSGDFTTIQAAIDACPEGAQSIIFIKNGTYNEQVTIGSKTVVSTKRISLIGENPDSVLITHTQSRASSGSPTFEDVCTLKLYTSDFYAENISIQNAAGNTGMAEALYTAADRQTFKNCHILGYQDTYRSKKGTRGYFKKCLVQGAVDFIYAGGVEFFDSCHINCVKGGGYIVAPEDAYVTIPKTSTVCQKFLRVGFFFTNCDITANSDVPANSFYLGRPWVSYAGAFYINCRLGSHINPAGWMAWGGNETTSSFAEYNSCDLNGIPVDTTKRVSWSFQLPKADVDNLLGADKIYARVSAVPYDPFTLCVAPGVPQSVVVTGTTLSWQPVTNATGYVVMKNGRYFASTTNTNTTDNSGTSGLYSVKAVGPNGALSAAGSVVTGLSPLNSQLFRFINKQGILEFNTPVRLTVYTPAGMKVSEYPLSESFNLNGMTKGVFLIQVSSENGTSTFYKIIN